MTAREHTRLGATDRGETPRIVMERAPTVSERLYAARQRKGVDLSRAERETKIRAVNLSALERGAFGELPGTVYTKGFLHNYAVYLGLDPDEVVGQWRREHAVRREAPAAIVHREPIAMPRKGWTVSGRALVAFVLALVVLAFGAYLTVQVLRFAKPPVIAVTQPATAVVDVVDGTTSYTLAGITTPGAKVSIATPGRDAYQVTAAADGSWTSDVDLVRGRNQFDVTALDPDTRKRSDATIRLYVTVPMPAVGPAASAGVEPGSAAGPSVLAVPSGAAE